MRIGAGHVPERPQSEYTLKYLQKNWLETGINTLRMVVAASFLPMVWLRTGLRHLTLHRYTLLSPLSSAPFHNT
jgi:hypothetical protein